MTTLSPLRLLSGLSTRSRPAYRVRLADGAVMALKCTRDELPQRILSLITSGRLPFGDHCVEVREKTGWQDAGLSLNWSSKATPQQRRLVA